MIAEWEIRQGDALERLREMPSESVHCGITSPPYWGLRDYGVDGAYGLEPTIQEYVDRIVETFREVRRVLRKDGTFWLNMGDTYYNGDKGGYHNDRTRDRNVIQAHNAHSDFYGAPNRQPQDGLKPKDIVGMPWMVAFALRADGWWLRRPIIWWKNAVMPESVDNRPTNDFEDLFLLAKSGDALFYTHQRELYRGQSTKPEPDHRWIHRETEEERLTEPPGDWILEWKRINLWKGHDYFYDKEAVKEPQSANTHARVPKSGGKPSIKTKHPPGQGIRANVDMQDALRGQWMPGGRNLRSVWQIPNEPYPAHFATFPEALPRRCIMAGTSERGVCPECGNPWFRVMRHGVTDAEVLDELTLGFVPTCEHDHEPVPATVLDPFSGAATTGLAAINLGRNYIGIELNPENVQMSRERLLPVLPMLTRERGLNA